MKPRLLFLVTIFFVVTSTVKGQYVFRKTLNLAYDYYSLPLPDGNFIFCGAIESPGTHLDVLLAKLTPSGDTLWSRVLGDTLNEVASCIQPTSDGGFILTGATTSTATGPADKCYLVKTDADGQVLWSKAYGGPYSNLSYFVDETADGGFVMIGTVGYMGYGDSLYVVKTDMSGNLLWSKTYNTSETNLFYRDAAATMDGGYLVAGGVYSEGFLLKIDAAGDPLWIQRYDSLQLMSVIETADNNIMVAGGTPAYGTTQKDMFVMKANASGIPLWTNTYPFIGTDLAYDVCMGNGGNALVTGIMQDETFLLNLSGDGSVNWTRSFISDTALMMGSWGNCLHVCPDGGYLMSATKTFLPVSTLPNWLIKTDSLGNTGCDSSLFLTPNPILPVWNTMTFMAATGGGLIPSILSVNTTGFEWAGEDCFGMAGILENKSNDHFLLYPNPASENLVLEGNVFGAVSICNVAGHVVKQVSKTANRTEIPVSDLTNGIYFWRCGPKTGKLVVQH